MRLLIDAGNMRIKWAIASNSRDRILAGGLIADDWSDLHEYRDKIESAWVSCVGSSGVLDNLKTRISDLFDVQAHVVKVSPRAAGMTNNYADLDKLGVDRWVAALGARSLVPHGALIVIDAGTAVTIDLVSADNSFEGGAILPGFAIMHDALTGRTAGIESNRQPVTSAIGKNTRDCVNSGIQYGLIGAIERLVCEIAASVDGRAPRLLITGGDAQTIVANSKLEVELQSDIMFHGLMLLSQK